MQGGTQLNTHSGSWGSISVSTGLRALTVVVLAARPRSVNHEKLDTHKTMTTFEKHSQQSSNKLVRKIMTHHRFEQEPIVVFLEIHKRLQHRDGDYNPYEIASRDSSRLTFELCTKKPEDQSAPNDHQPRSGGTANINSKVIAMNIILVGSAARSTCPPSTTIKKQRCRFRRRGSRKRCPHARRAEMGRESGVTLDFNSVHKPYSREAMIMLEN